MKQISSFYNGVLKKSSDLQDTVQSFYNPIISKIRYEN